jgi:hypothetical protein
MPTLPPVPQNLYRADREFGDWLNRLRQQVSENTAASGVSSVFGRTGAVVANAADYSGIYVPVARTLTAGSGLTGGGDLSANRSLALTGVPLALFNLASASGWLKNDGADVLSYSTPTKSDVGLGNVDNTSDLNKPISTATQTALDAKVPTTRTINGYDLSANRTLTAADVSAVPTTRTVNGLALSTDIEIPIGWELIEDYEVSGGAVSSITVSGLDGDVDEFYFFQVWVIATGALGGFDVRPNNDTTANNYRYQYLQVANATVAGARADYSNGMIIGNANTNLDVMMADGLIHAKSGQRRIMIARAGSNINATTQDVFHWTSQWKDTAANITSLVFDATGAGNVINNGTRVRLFKAVAL